MITKEQVKEAKWRILMVCVKDFIEEGFLHTHVNEIAKEADVTVSSFRRLFKNKDGVLFELIDFMFDNQFALARKHPNEDPVHVYALETAIQLSIAETHDHIREIYLEAYTDPGCLEFIRRRTASELLLAFKSFNPTWEEEDFYEAEIGSSGLMRGYMEHPCDSSFTFEKKIKGFLSFALKGYNVPGGKIQETISSVLSLDLGSLGAKALNKFFDSLERTFGCKLSEASKSQKKAIPSA